MALIGERTLATKDRTVVVDGAEGFLGSAVVRALVADTGHRTSVRALVLDAEGDRAKVPEGAEVIAAPLGDPSEESIFAPALRGARAVVAARRITHERPREGITYRRVHFERVTRLLAAAKKAGVERFIYAGLAGNALRGPAEVEREVKAHLAASRLPALYLNLPMVVGPGDEVVSRMVRKARSVWPVITFIGQGWTKAAPLTREDFAGCVAALVAADDFPTGQLDLAGPEKLSVMDIQDRLLGLAGRRKVKLHIMASAAAMCAWLAERLFAGGSRSYAVAWMLDERVPKRSAARKLLGRRPDAFEKAFPEVDAPRSEGEDPAPAAARAAQGT